jgi:hypothetical protein
LVASSSTTTPITKAKVFGGIPRKVSFLEAETADPAFVGRVGISGFGDAGSKRAKFQAEACRIKTMATEPAASHVSF